MAKVEVWLKPIAWENQVLIPMGLILLDVLEHGTRSMGVIALPKDSYKNMESVQRILQRLITNAEHNATQ